MTNYEYLMGRKDEAERKAKKLTIEEAGKRFI